MPNYRRDALLAAAVAVALLGVLATRGALEALLAPVSITGGVVSALLVEALFLRSDFVASLWKRPVVHVGGGLGVVAGGLVAYSLAGPTVLAALCWGLATYFLLLGALLARRGLLCQ